MINQFGTDDVSSEHLDLAACSVCCLKVRGCETLATEDRTFSALPPLLSRKRSQPCRVFKHVSHTFVFLSNLFGHFSGAGVFEAVRTFVCSRYLLIDT